MVSCIALLVGCGAASKQGGRTTAENRKAIPSRYLPSICCCRRSGFRKPGRAHITLLLLFAGRTSGRTNGRMVASSRQCVRSQTHKYPNQFRKLWGFLATAHCTPLRFSPRLVSCLFLANATYTGSCLLLANDVYQNKVQGH